MYTRILQVLVTEMCKVKIGESPSITHEVFQIDNSNNYNLRKKNLVTLKMELKPFPF